MSLHLSPRIEAITPSLTLTLDEKVRSLQAQGKKVLNFTIGQPDFNTPEWIGEAARRAIASGATRYTSPIGTLELRQAVTKWFERKTGIPFTVPEVLVCCGSKHAIYNALQAMVNPGDEVVVPAPYWVSYPDLVRMAGGVPIHPRSSLEEGYKLTPARLAAVLTPKTRAIILNSPCNPSGAVYNRAEAAALAELLVTREIAVISDEIYDQIIYDGVTHAPFVAAHPRMRERTITVNGVSKAYAMTGWRIGFAAGPKEIIEGMGRYQGQATSNPCSISQEAALAAITGNGPELEQMRQAYARRRDLVAGGLAGVPGLELRPPDGAFYMLLRVSGVFGRKIDGQPLNSAEEISEALIDRGVAILPGSGFGVPDSLRLSFATAEEDLRHGVEIIRDFFTGLARG